MKRLSLLINKINSFFWARIVKSTHSNTFSLTILRVLTGLFLLLLYSPGYGWIGTSPPEFFKPPFLSIAVLFGSFPSTGFFQVIDILLLLCTVCIIFGIKAKFSSLSYCFFSVIALSFQYSLGKIDHNILLYVMIFCLSFSGWGSELAIIPDKKVSINSQNKSLSLLAFILCFAFFTAGFNKALNWINFDFNQSGTALWIYSEYYIVFRQHLLADLVKSMPFYTFKFMDYFGVAFELSPIIFLLYSRKSWGIWLLIASLFHISTTLFLNIAFLSHAIIYLAFIDLSSIYIWAKRMVERRPSKLVVGSILAILSFIRLHDIIDLTTAKILFIPDSQVKEGLILSIVIWIIIATMLFINVLKSKRDDLDPNYYKAETFEIK